MWGALAEPRIQACRHADGDGDGMDVDQAAAFGRDATRAFLLSCFDVATGAVDAAALASAERRHNREVIRQILWEVSGDFVLSVSVLGRDSEERVCGAQARFARTGDGQFKLVTEPTSRGGTARLRWQLEHLAHGISALSLTHVLYFAESHPIGGHAGVGAKVDELAGKLWLPTAVRALSSHPASEPWTADCILRMRPLLAFLVDICARRNSVPSAGRWTAWVDVRASPACPAGREILDRARETHSGSLVDEAWRRAIGLEQSLRGMLAWIKALERTDVVATHLLGRAPIPDVPAS